MQVNISGLSKAKLQFERKDIIVTGGTGFIGSNLIRILISFNANVHLLIRNKSNLWRLEDIKKFIHIIKIDLLDLHALSKIIGKINPQYIFHFAFPSNDLLQSPFDFQRQLDLTSGHLLNLLQSISSTQGNLKSFIHACSSTLYQWSEERYRLNENTPFDPYTLRGMLKLNERNICQYFSRNHGLPIKLARIFRAYGPWEINHKLIISALDAARNNNPIPLANNRYKRDYIFTNDLVKGILLLANSKLHPGTEMNFGSNSQFSAFEIVKILEEILEIEIPKTLNSYPKNPYDKGNFIADITFAKEMLNWQPKFSIREGLQITVDWYKEYYQWQVKSN